MTGAYAMGKILTGTCSWTDKTLIDSGWYGQSASSAESRLAAYAERFPVVEVDSTYYSPPSERTAMLWADRTPDQFTFDVKAYRLLTGHPAQMATLPKHLRELVPESSSEKPNIYLKDLPDNVTDKIWSDFRQALMPLHSAGKLGVVLFQFPHWFLSGSATKQYLASINQRLPEFQPAVEFRHPSWLNEMNQDRTIQFLRDSDLAYVAVDEPQGTRQSVPPIAAVTSNVAVVRFHGRRTETWDRANVGVLERFRYLYSESELEEWVPKIRELAREADEVHALMNNCYGDFAVKNAAQLSSLLEPN